MRYIHGLADNANPFSAHLSLSVFNFIKGFLRLFCGQYSGDTHLQCVSDLIVNLPDS